MGRHIAAAPIFAALLVLASTVRLERLAEGKYRVEAIFAATASSPRQAITRLFTTRERAEVAYWHYLLRKTPSSEMSKDAAGNGTPPSSTR